MSNHLPTKTVRGSGYIPGYKRIEKSLRERVSAGYWRAGDLLPSRRELAQEYNVDLNTLQRAIGPLLEDGTLQTNGNRGTFVPGAERVFHYHTPARTTLPQTADVGIIAAVDPDSEWVRAIVQAVESTLSGSGATSRYFDIRRAGRDEGHIGAALKEAASSLLQDGVGGLIVVGIYDTPGLTEGVASLLSLTEAPIVHISWHDTRRPLHHVFYDSRFAGYLAAHHLLQCGYTRFAFVAPFQAGWVEERIESARMALGDAGLPGSALSIVSAKETPEYPVSAERHVEAGSHAFGWAAGQGLVSPGTGLIAANDKIAHGFLRAAQDAGEVAGKAFGLIGFDDDLASRSLGLTTVRPPLEGLGAEGAKLVLRAIAGERTGVQIRLHSRIIARSSTCSQAG